MTDPKKAARKAAGLCVQCGVYPAEPHRVSCLRCLRRDRAAADSTTCTICHEPGHTRRSCETFGAYSDEERTAIVSLLRLVETWPARLELVLSGDQVRIVRADDSRALFATKAIPLRIEQEAGNDLAPG